MKTKGVKASVYSGSSATSPTSDVGFRTRQLEGMRAFQAGRSWYDAYWYPEPQARRPAAISRALSILGALWASWAAGREAERLGEPTLALR
jgi:hypothetical protein